MKITKTMLGLACVPALYALSAPAADEIAFHPAEGTTLVKTITTETEMSLDNMSILINGSPPPMDMGDFAMNMSDRQSITVTDQYQAVAGGRPAKLKRTYDEISKATDVSVDIPMMGSSTEQSIEAFSDLEGETVQFTLEEDEYVTAFADGEGDEELLDGLYEDMDFRFMLPAGPVSAGDSWEIPLDDIKYLLAPGGKLSLVPEESEGDANPFGGFNQHSQEVADMLGDMDGTATAEYMGTTEVDGVKVGKIRVTIEVNTANDMSDMVRAAMEDTDLPEEVGEMELDVSHMDIELEVEAEGTLYWNLERGVFHSLELSGIQTMLMDMAMNMVVADNDMEMEQTFEMSGNFSMTARAE